MQTHLRGIRAVRALGDGGFLVGGDDGVIRLDADLQRIGLLVGGPDAPSVRAMAVEGNALAVLLGAQVLQVPLDVDAWADAARRRAGSR